MIALTLIMAGVAQAQEARPTQVQFIRALAIASVVAKRCEAYSVNEPLVEQMIKEHQIDVSSSHAKEIMGLAIEATLMIDENEPAGTCATGAKYFVGKGPFPKGFLITQ